MRKILTRPNLSYGQKLFLLATLPLIVAVAAISVLVALQSRALTEREISTLEAQLIDAKKQELKNYVTLARNSFYYIYGNADPDDETAKRKIMQILAAMIYGQEGYFFVYDYDGTNLVSPRQTDMINQNWAGLTDSNGVPVTDELIRIARSGGGYHTYLWPKPSSGVEAQMVTYVTSFPSWRWAVGTGVFVDDVIATVINARHEMETRIRRTFLYIGVITMLALLAVFGSGMFINVRERRLADSKLKRLTQRVLDAQEEERGRVARELHDSISQILVGVRYAVELARKRFATNDPRAGEALDRSMHSLSGAIQEVRRISRDLRPGVLDDLGLGPAIKALTDDFSTRTGIKTDFSTVVFRNRLDQDARISLYRIAQEALTNIERHSGADHVIVDLRGHRSGASLTIKDNGHGIDRDAERDPSGGMGLRNMQERVDQLDGSLSIQSNRQGTTIIATVPLSHLLTPESGRRNTNKPATELSE
jgi:two-component system NarL family sensor kinase